MGVGNNGNLIPAKPGEARNPKGKPKGTKHISTHIKNILNDPKLKLKLSNGEMIEGVPIEAIIKAAIIRAAEGDVRAFDVLAKHGYGERKIHEFNGNPTDEILRKFGLGDAGQDTEA